ncbi:hypothetical protein KM043_000413 [Ampulex compressa]|nr:hypothetical protein KM043_000413 [Ampulex compressa]
MDPSRTDASSAILAWNRCKARLLHLRPNSDRIFYRIGLSIGSKPWLWLIISACISCACGPGMLLWKEEVDDVELFMPKDSVVRADAKWVKEHFRDDLRYESIIVVAPNVLEPEVLRSIDDIERDVKGIVVNEDRTWQDVCAGYFTWFENDESSDVVGDFEFSADIIHNLNETMLKDRCIYQSILKLWQDALSKDVRKLSRKDILEDVARALRDKISSNVLSDIAPLLADLTYDRKGRLKGARATILNWMLKKSSPHSDEWELEFIERVLRSNRSLPAGMEVYAVASRSFKDFLRQVVDNNMTILFCGMSLIAIYVILMIGRCNFLEQRIYLSLMGISVVGQAILSSYGVCYYVGFSYGPVHPILPFLLLGIGVDDMFVIMQSLENLSEDDKTLRIPVRIAKAMQHSGMSITVTSFTNVVAFGIGVTTVMPFLRSFCTFAAMGILFLYIFELTFFVSCVVYDERRLEARKDGCCCRPKPNWRPNECSRKNIQQFIFEKYVGPYVMKPGVKVLVLMLTACLLLVNAWAIFHLQRNFDPLWYLNQDSYPVRFNDKLQQYFPKYGKRAAIYLTGIDYFEDRRSLLRLVDLLRANRYVNNRTLEPWFVAYENWLEATNKASDIESKEEYYNILTEYLLLTKEGQAYIKDINFDKFPVGEYNITTSQIPIQHIPINTTSDQVRAMQSLRESVGATNISQGGEHIPIYSVDYVSWTANKIIGEELLRNLCLEILAVGAVTVLLLRDFKASFWVMCCVLFTLIDLLGSMYFLGLTIEISSSIIILLCAGLAVDYAAHVGLEFTRAKGNKEERAIETLSVIGPAVFNGGLSTFLAFVLLGSSKTFIFSMFFKLFSSVVIFGLFHGLLFLPIILSVLGPDERKIDDARKESARERNGYCTVNLDQNKKDVEGGSTK